MTHDDVAAPASGTAVGYKVSDNWGAGFIGHMQVAAGATALGLTAEAARQVEPAIPLLQSAMQYAPWVVGIVALALWGALDGRLSRF